MILQYSVHFIKRSEPDNEITYSNTFNQLFDSLPAAKEAIYENIAQHVPHVKHREIVDCVAPHSTMEIRAFFRHRETDQKPIMSLEYIVRPMKLGPQLANLLTLMGHGEDGAS
jgi:hypothetical protein